jgi:FkbM family methyltransferase
MGFKGAARSFYGAGDDYNFILGATDNQLVSRNAYVIGLNMNVGNRSLGQFLKAITGKQHYAAFLNMIKVCPDFFEVFVRYFLGKGGYHYKVKIRTPLGIIVPTLFSYYDMLTVNEIFCRLDYGVDNGVKVVVDFGSNIGISALYFLTRNIKSRCYLFEPVPENIKKLRDNLNNYRDRYVLSEVAVSNKNGINKFGTDKFGRCGGLLREAENYIDVECEDVNDILRNILIKETIIDVLKIDTEGNELDIINAIEKSVLSKIKVIFFEIDYTVKLANDFRCLPDYYDQFRVGNTVKLILKSERL